jgi:glycerate 2-kinase
MSLREDAKRIIAEAIGAVQPRQAVGAALAGRQYQGRVIMIALGKAAYPMAAAAADTLSDKLTAGLVITKPGHTGPTPIPRTEVIFGGHPVPDAGSVKGAARALELVHGLTPRDTVVLLISGGGSALFELPVIPLEELRKLSESLLRSGASIGEMNTVRKRLSKVKAGRFAMACAPARVVAVVLSDVIGDRLDVIASGPAAADPTTTAQALAIVEQYNLHLSPEALSALSEETPKHIDHVETHITGSVAALCRAAEQAARELGYSTLTLTYSLDCEAREAGSFLGAIARHYHALGGRRAILCGGETVVRVTGSGLGGRNQELALSAARYLDGLEGALLVALGSDGTDGPTDAAGGMVDARTARRLRERGISLHDALENNDSYHALAAVDDLIFTGPTGTNVNDLYMLLLDPPGQGA